MRRLTLEADESELEPISNSLQAGRAYLLFIQVVSPREWADIPSVRVGQISGRSFRGLLLKARRDSSKTPEWSAEWIVNKE